LEALDFISQASMAIFDVRQIGPAKGRVHLRSGCVYTRLRSRKPFKTAFVRSGQAVSGHKKESQYLLAVLIKVYEFGANVLIANVVNGSSTIDGVATQRKRKFYYVIELERLSIHFDKAYSIPGNICQLD
jgi:hypothetical protein